MAPAKPKTNTRLPEIAKAIKLLEKKNIGNIVAIGKLLHEAHEQCDHGEWLPWLKDNFSWSDDTATRYRDVYALSQIPQFADFAKWDISISALYRVAFCLIDNGPDYQAAGLAIIEAARHGRVSCKMAIEIETNILDECLAKRVAVQDAAPLPAAESEQDDESESEQDDESEPDDAIPAAKADDGTLYCSFCSKSGHVVSTLVKGTTGCICNECLELCAGLKTDAGEPVCIAPGSDDQKILLLKKLDEQLIQSLDWADVIEKVGRDVILTIITGLQRQLEQRSSAVEAAADRAEAKTKMRLN
jgi:hypothetical protein